MRTDPRIETCGFTQSPIGQAASEVDSLRNRVAVLESVNAGQELAIRLLESHRDEAIKQRDEARAACAEMRQRITNAHDRLLRGDDDSVLLKYLRDSWGPATGKGWLSPEVGNVLVESLQKLAVLGNEPMPGNSVGNRIAQQALSRAKEAGL